jgi:hypothetical protein
MVRIVEQLRQVLTDRGCAEVDGFIPNLIRAFEVPGDHDEAVRDVLLMLRSHRCFGALDELASALGARAQGSLGIFIRRQLVQAKVDRGRLDDAIVILNTLQDDVRACGSAKDRSEVAGLLGRLHKQRFVSATDAAELQAAIACHASVFALDPSWHGANIVALSARAERDRIAIDTGTARAWADRLLRELNDRGRASWGPWDYAAAGEAYLARNEPERSAECYQSFWNAPNVDAFALGGAARQLREVWQADTRGDDFLSSLLHQLEARTLGRPGGRVEWSPRDLGERVEGIGRDLSERGRAEALFGADSTLQLNKLLTLIGRAGSICRVFDPLDSRKGGTGFLVDGALFGLTPGPLLLTNHHVLHEPAASRELLDRSDYSGSVRVDRAQVRFTYWGGKPVEQTFTLKEIIRSSTRDDADFALASLAGEIPQEMTLPISTADEPLRSRNNVDPKQVSKILIVGHPRGEALTFSLSDTEVVDHELDDEPRTRPRRIHYRTTTDHGSSGSPAFEFDTLDVVGLHRSGRAAPLRENWPGKKQGEPYEANEAVWIGSVRAAR